MQKNIDSLLAILDEKDYDKVVSFIEFLVDTKKKKTERQKTNEEQVDVDAIVASLIGAIPDTGKTLEEYRTERLKKYEISD